MHTCTVTIEQYHDSEPVFVATSEDLPGLAVGAASRHELIEMVAVRALPLLGMLGLSDRRCRLVFRDAEGV